MLIANRRGLLRGTAAAAALPGPFAALVHADAARAPVNGDGEQTAPAASPHGPIAPVLDGCGLTFWGAAPGWRRPPLPG
jgi:hypothetical protein